MKKYIIVAKAKNNVIGRGNRMPWHISEDLKRFKEITMGYPVIMGRKTFISIGKPLNGRLNIIVTSNPVLLEKNDADENLKYVSSINEAIDIVEKSGHDKCFIIGGASIYSQTIDIVDGIYLTEIKNDYDGDAFFPKIDKDRWKITEETDWKYSKTERDVQYRFINFLKREK